MVCLSRKTLGRFFILLHHCFYSCKSQIRSKQTGLTIRFAIPQTNLCSCVQKIKNKHSGGTDVAFFVSACITHSLVERLSTLTALLGNTDKSRGNVNQHYSNMSSPDNSKTVILFVREISQQMKLCVCRFLKTEQKNYNNKQ